MLLLFVEIVILLISVIGAKQQIIIMNYTINLGLFTFFIVNLGIFILLFLFSLIMYKEEENI